MSIFDKLLNMFSCCQKQNDSFLTDIQTSNLDVPISSISVGNLTFNYTTDGIAVDRIENIFNMIDIFDCGKTQLRQLNEALKGSTIHFKKGNEYMCDVQDGSDGKKTVVFTLPETLPSKLVLPCVTLPEDGLAIISNRVPFRIEYKKAPKANVQKTFKILVFGSQNSTPEIKKIDFTYKSPEEIEAYLMGHEIFHAISRLKGTETSCVKPGDDINEISKKYINDENVVNSISKFFEISQLDDMNNLFGFEKLENGERIVCEYDYIKEFTDAHENIVRFPYDLSKAFNWCKENKDLFKFIYKEKMKNQLVVLENLNTIAEEAWQKDKYEDTTKEANQVLNLVKQYHENDTMKVFNDGI